MLRGSLFNGYSVSYLSSFLDPFIQSGDELTFDPIYDTRLVQTGDVVLCEPSPNYILMNKVLGITTAQGYVTKTSRPSNIWFAISNKDGQLDMWANEDNLIGRLVVVESAKQGALYQPAPG